MKRVFATKSEFWIYFTFLPAEWWFRALKSPFRIWYQSGLRRAFWKFQAFLIFFVFWWTKRASKIQTSCENYIFVVKTEFWVFLVYSFYWSWLLTSYKQNNKQFSSFWVLSMMGPGCPFLFEQKQTVGFFEILQRISLLLNKNSSMPYCYV
jgi:hypothetical protein